MNFDYRHTKIIFTIGPATESEEMIEQLILNGADVCRLNMAHASREWTEMIIRRVRHVGKKVGRHIAIMMDVKGPEIRTGDLPEPIELQEGEIFDFITEGVREEKLEEGYRGVTVNYTKLNKDVSIGSTLLVDSGLVRMEVLEVHEDRVRTKVIIPGPMGNRRHINLPGVKVSLPSLTRKDKNDMEVGLQEGIEFYALSFVREADDLDIMRRYLEERGSKAKIIAKIEDQSAIFNLDEIIVACDGLMVARGDLGIECPYEQLPVIQRRAINECIKHQKPVIVATHMLESMISAPIPTRAEVTDIANAVFEKADCVMLSGETTTGKYPVECVTVMNRIARQIEHTSERGFLEKIPLKTPKARMLKSATILAQDLENSGIVVFTRSGYLAQVLSSLRPTRCPIFAFTDDELVFRQMNILWGIEPFFMKFSGNPEETVKDAFRMLVQSRHKWAEPGDWVVVVSNLLAGDKVIDTIQMRCIDTSLDSSSKAHDPHPWE